LLQVARKIKWRNLSHNKSLKTLKSKEKIVQKSFTINEKWNI
jgi:hypothetical protein